MNVRCFLFAAILLLYRQGPAAEPAPGSLVDQATDGTILLHAKDAATHGTTIRYEPQPHKNTIGYWTQPQDYVTWEFVVAQPGRFVIELVQGCGAGSGGSEVAVLLDEQRFLFRVVETGGFQNFLPRLVGEVRISERGRHRCTVRALSKPGVAVMDLRQINLRRK